MADRYFASGPITGQHALLEGPEAHHLSHVLRAKAGDVVSLFDGTGAEFSARVQSIGRATVELEVLSRQELDRELPRIVTLAVSLPKGDRQRWLVEKATELGVTCLTPLLTNRGVAEPTASVIARLQRAVVEASKQCGRNRLMEISDPVIATEYFRRELPTTVRGIAHPPSTLAESRSIQLSRIRLPMRQSLVFAIGPEGGFTDQEVQTALDFGWTQVDLGPRILRVETAAIALAAWAALECQGGSA